MDEKIEDFTIGLIFPLTIEYVASSSNNPFVCMDVKRPWVRML
jgi:hypothetical protein